jgi:hypothetical protein
MRKMLLRSIYEPALSRDVMKGLGDVNLIKEHGHYIINSRKC